MRAEEIDTLGIGPLVAAFDEGALRAVDVVEAYLDRIERLDAELHAYSALWPEKARERAKALDRGRVASGSLPTLFGVPVAVKDLCDVAGEPTRAGTTVLGDRPAAGDAEVVERLEAAGAVILGKTRMTEGAFISHHPSVVPPVNPWNADRWTGISSSGSGVAVAAGLCLGALGTDTGGSIRFPSAACGLTGLKPTHGRVSLRGVFPLSGSLDHVGPMARSVDDVARLFAVLAGPDPGDPWSLGARAVVPSATVSPRTRGVRIGVDRAYCRTGVEASIAAVIEESLEVLAELGAEIVEVDLPAVDDVMGAWVSIAAAEAAAAHADTFPSRSESYGEELRATLELGRRVDGRTVAEAWKTRIAFSRRLESVFESMDAMIAPVIPDLFVANTNLGDIQTTPAAAVAVHFTSPFNVSGLPSLTLPGGLDREGVPIGFQLVAPRGGESRLLELGLAFQAATDWHSLRPDLDPPG